MSEAISAGREPAVEVRPLRNVAEAKLGVELQKLVWNYSDLDTVPDQMFIVAKESGGQVLAAFHGEKAVGFALSFAGAHDGKVYLHSHMVAVLPDYQNRGVGKLLKLAQREDAIARGIDVIEWTFDPLQLKNANFNLEKLGAVVRRYRPNFYGRTSSPLHAGLPTDRLVAEWHLTSDRVRATLASKTIAMGKERVRIPVPKDIREICTSRPQDAETIQSDTRNQFESWFAKGWAAVGFEISAEHGTYVLEPYED